MPVGNSSQCRNKASCAFPHSSMSTHPSAPQMTPQIARMMISRKRCSLVRSMRGSSTCANMLSRISSVVLFHHLVSRFFDLVYHLLVLSFLWMGLFRCDCPVIFAQSLD